jgi:hypothetical protein
VDLEPDDELPGAGHALDHLGLGLGRGESSMGALRRGFGGGIGGCGRVRKRRACPQIRRSGPA